MRSAELSVLGPFLGAVLSLLGGAVQPTVALAGPHEDCGGVLHSAERTEEAHRAADASALYDHASSVCESLPDSPVKAIAFNDIGHAYFRLGRFADAQATVAHVLAIREKTLPPTDSRIAESLTDLGFLDDNMGRFAESEDLLKRAAALQEKVHGPDHPDLAKVLNDLAALYLHLGRYREAEPLMKRATAIWEKAPAGDDYATSLNNLAVLYGLQGRYAEDESSIRRALALREKSGVDVDTSLDNLASLYVAEGRWDDAEPLIKRALDIQRRKGAAEPPSLTILASIYREQHRYRDAEAALGLALSESEKTSGAVFRDVAHGLRNLGGLYTEEGRYAEAEPLLERAAAIREKSLGSDNREFASDLYALAYVDALQGHTAEAETILQRALAIQDAALESDHPDIAKSLDRLAAIHETEGNIAGALEDSRKAVSILVRRNDQARDDPSNEGAFEQKSNRALFIRLVHLLWTNASDRDDLPPETVDEAFRAAQLAGGADTAKAISGMAARYAAGDDTLAALVRDREDLSNRWKKLDSDLLKSAAEAPEKRSALADAALRKEQADVAAKLNAENDKLRTVFPRFAELAEARPVGIAEVRDVLGPDEAFVAFSLGPSESFVFVVRKADAHMFRLSLTSDEATKAVKALREPLTTYGAFNLSEAHTLYTELFAAADPLIAGAKTLIITPDGALQSLPFAVLTTAPVSDDPNAPDYKSAPWLIRRQAVTIEPAASSLVALRRYGAPKRGSDPFAGFGDPVFDGSGEKRGIEAAVLFRGSDSIVANLRGLPRLPETATELRTEAQALGAPETSVYLGPNATVSVVKHVDLSKVRVVSFATHGVVANDLPKLGEPALVMSPPSHPTADDDGLLRASEVAQLKLSADFVILSACNTAAPDGAPGAEGLSGLAKAFFYAGARSVLVSHWEVNSYSAVRLTTGLIGALAADPGIGRAEALRRASLGMIDSHSEIWSDGHPYFWSPFILVGEGGIDR